MKWIQFKPRLIQFNELKFHKDGINHYFGDSCIPSESVKNDLLSFLHFIHMNHIVLFLVRKTIAIAFWIALIFLTLIISGVNLNNIWVYLGGFLSVVAIELFAVWSILSNIISGIFIFIMNPFKIGSKIKLYDPEVQATVVNINLMFTELQDDDGIFNVPNNTFFQKTVKGINAEKTQPN